MLVKGKKKNLSNHDLNFQSIVLPSFGLCCIGDGTILKINTVSFHGF